MARSNDHDLANLPHKLAPLRRTFGAYRAVQITTATMRAYADARLEHKAAPATVNSELGLLRRMLNLAHEDGRLLHVPAVPMLRVNNARTGFLEPADFEALVAALTVPLRPLVRFAYLTGWRKGEILGLTGDRIDIQGGTIRLDAHPTGSLAAAAQALGVAVSTVERLFADLLDAEMIERGRVQ
jgi:integrase